MTEAEKIAERYGDDGQRWEDDDGVQLLDLLAEVKTSRWDRRDGMDVWELEDGSMIVTCDGFWDVVTVNGSRWEDSNGEPLADLHDDGEPKGWGYRA
jgi:hypothetical protein